MSTLRATLTTIRPDEPKPIEIILDGQNLGTVEPFKYCAEGSCHWHASFKPIGGDSCALIQGFGETPEEAIADAFVQKRTKLERSLVLVAELKKAMYSE